MIFYTNFPIEKKKENYFERASLATCLVLNEDRTIWSCKIDPRPTTVNV